MCLEEEERIVSKSSGREQRTSGSELTTTTPMTKRNREFGKARL